MNFNYRWVIQSFSFLFLACQQQPFTHKEKFDPSCKPMNETQSRIYLTNNYMETLANSLINLHPTSDSCIRIWHLEQKLLDSTVIYRLELFEYVYDKQVGEKTNRSIKTNYIRQPYAYYSIIQVQGPVIDSLWKITCLKSSLLVPKKGWDYFEMNIRVYRYDKIYQMPKDQGPIGNCNQCMLKLQYVKPNHTETIDFSHLIGPIPSTYPRDNGFLEYISLINNEFALKIGFNDLRNYNELFEDEKVQMVFVDSLKNK